MHRDGVGRASRAVCPKNKRSGSQAGGKSRDKNREVSMLGSTSIAHGQFSWRIHSNRFDINITGRAQPTAGRFRGA